MKKLISLLVIIIMTTSLSFGQTVKLKGTSFSLKVGDKAWTTTTACSIIIVFNFDEKDLTIYSAEPQQYDLVQYLGKTTDKDGDEITGFVAIDKKGIKCNIRWMKLNSQGGRLQVYVQYNDVSWLYNMNLLK